MSGRGEKLTDKQRAFVVQRLAMWDTPETIAKAVKEEFGVEVTRQAVHAYDPTKVAGADLAKKWRDLFNATRKAFIEDTAEIGISHRSARLRTLNRMAVQAEQMGNLALAKDLLKQAAEEMGNAYTNKREFSGPGGKDLPAPSAQVVIQIPDNGR